MISRALSSGDDAGWAFTARTWLFDRFVTEEIARGVEMVVHLAAGVDARPYRMDLPPSLQWIEIDLQRNGEAPLVRCVSPGAGARRHIIRAR